MALTLIKENGSGLANANAYANVTDGDAYHDGHLYASAWIAASAGDKEKALVMASRLIDGQFQFAGWKTNPAQALQWPRVSCRDPDGDDDLESNIVPAALLQAACELARELLVADRTAAPEGEGLKYENTGTTQKGYDKKDTRPVIPKVAQALLSKYGIPLNRRSGNVALVRS